MTKTVRVPVYLRGKENQQCNEVASDLFSSFSDSYKDQNGSRPRFPITVIEVLEWLSKLENVTYAPELQPELCFWDKDDVKSGVIQMVDFTGLESDEIQIDRDGEVINMTLNLKTPYTNGWVPIIMETTKESKEFIGKFSKGYIKFYNTGSKFESTYGKYTLKSSKN